MSDMSNPDSLKYTKDHEWVRLEGETGVVGITDHAQDALGDVVFVELPAAGTEVRAGEQFGTVESVKAVSELYSPLSGTVVEVNEALEDGPEQINQEPYGAGWMIKVRLAAPAEVESLLDAAAYGAMVEES